MRPRVTLTNCMQLAPLMAAAAAAVCMELQLHPLVCFWLKPKLVGVPVVGSRRCGAAGAWPVSGCAVGPRGGGEEFVQERLLRSCAGVRSEGQLWSVVLQLWHLCVGLSTQILYCAFGGAGSAALGLSFQTCTVGS